MNQKSEKQVTNYSIALKGVFGRNRSVKLKVVKLKDVDAGQPELTAEQVQELVNQTLAAEKAKPGLHWRVTKQAETVTQYDTGDGHILESRSFMVFSGTTVAEGVVA